MANEEEKRNLISLLSNIKNKINENKVNLKNCILQLIGLLERYYTNQDTNLRTAQKHLSNIYTIEKKGTTFIRTNPRCNVHDITEDTTTLIESIIDEINALGIPRRKALDNSSMNLNISQNQEQNQDSNIDVNILFEAVKDELTGKQHKEIIEIAKNSNGPKEAHKSILEKLKEFGEDVSSNIVANILTNPTIWKWLVS